MARVLLAWEFGGDLGHVRRLLALAGQLRKLGHDVALVFADMKGLGERVAELECFQAPLLRLPASPSPSPLSATDILLNLGYGDSSSIEGALRAWFGIFRVWQPQVVVADYAPTALLAARASSLPRVSLGSGFSQPRASTPLPPLRDWVDTDAATLSAFDAKLLASLRTAFDRLRLSAAMPHAAHEIFAADLELFCTFPEIDPFGPRDGGIYTGPISDGATQRCVDWQGAAGPKVFAYLKPRDPRFPFLLTALAKVAREVIVAAPGLDAMEALALSTPTMRVVASAVDLDPLLPRADLCVTHAGSGASTRAVLAGVPLALLPMQLEQFLVARRLSQAGVAAMVSPEEASPDFAEWLGALLARTDMRLAARAYAKSHAGHSAEEAAAAAARRIASLAAG